MGGREAAVRAHQAAAAGGRDRPVQRDHAQGVLAGQDVLEKAAQETAGGAVGVATNATAPPPDDGPTSMSPVASSQWEATPPTIAL